MRMRIELLENSEQGSPQTSDAVNRKGGKEEGQTMIPRALGYENETQEAETQTAVTGQISPRANCWISDNNDCKRPYLLSRSSSSDDSRSPSPAKTFSDNMYNFIEDTCTGYNSGDEYNPTRRLSVSSWEWKRRDRKFAKALAECGFSLKNVREDGACLFRAVALQLFGNEELHNRIRQITMDYIERNSEYFSNFITENISNYIERKRRADAHGNHIEVKAISEISNRPVEVYCYNLTPISIFNSRCFINGSKPLRLSYQHESHYNAIVDANEAAEGMNMSMTGHPVTLQGIRSMQFKELDTQKPKDEHIYSVIKGEDMEGQEEKRYFLRRRSHLKRSSWEVKDDSASTADEKVVDTNVTSAAEQSIESVSTTTHVETTKDPFSSDLELEKDTSEGNFPKSLYKFTVSRRKRKRHVSSTLNRKKRALNLSTDKCSKQQASLVAPEDTAFASDVEEQPTSSKKSCIENKAVNELAIKEIATDSSSSLPLTTSNLYIELLQASFAAGGFGELNEYEMLQNVMEMSANEYVKEQNREDAEEL